MSGLSATTLSCPADVIKTRMMNQAADKQGKNKYRNSYDCLVKTVGIEGVKALWKGFFPTWARLGPWQFVFWVSYEKFRQIAGLSATTLSCPADVIKTRMMNQAADKQGKNKYRNSYDCLVKTVGIEGVKALWKGFFPTWARLGPWQFVFWVSYEKFRQIAAGRSENMAVPGTLGISHICREVQKQPIGRYQYEEDITILFLKLSWRAIRWNKQYMCQLGVKIVA
nr:mitochondrial uncoupling protein 3 [Nicotiana tomentosiformis]